MSHPTRIVLAATAGLLTLGLLGQGFAAAKKGNVNVNDGGNTNVNTNENNNGNSNANANTNKSKKSKTYDTACVQRAIGTRDGTIADALTTNHATLQAALALRTEAMKAAAALTTNADRKAAHHDARDAWRTSAKTSVKTLKTERDAAWKSYKTNLKSCGTSAPKSDDNTKGIDEVLTNPSATSGN